MANDYILYLKFKSTIGDFEYQGRFQKILYYISKENVEILYQFSKEESNPGEIKEFEEIQKIKGIGTFLDILALSTEIITSCDFEGYTYKISKEVKKEFYGSGTEFKTMLSKLPQNLNHLSYDSFPNIIDENTRHTYNPETMELFRYLLQCFEKQKFENSKILSILNYWRKGLILDMEHLGFDEEGYLNFYKIIEYFIEKNSYGFLKWTFLLRKIPFLKNYFFVRDKEISRLNRIFVKKLKINHNKGLAEIVLEFIEIRNNWDVAHLKIKKISNIEERNCFFNITIHENIWQYNSFIKEISRFFILRYLGFENIQLKSSGGLYNLEVVNESLL